MARELALALVAALLCASRAVADPVLPETTLPLHLVGTVVAGGLFSAYVATTRSFGESSAQAALQRQGTLVLEEIGRQVRGAVEPNLDFCDGNAECIERELAALWRRHSELELAERVA